MLASLRDDFHFANDAPKNRIMIMVLGITRAPSKFPQQGHGRTARHNLLPRRNGLVGRSTSDSSYWCEEEQANHTNLDE